MVWINQCMSKHKPFQQKAASTMVVDSGATSSFVWPEENLPITGLSSKVVNLPNGSAIQATHTTILPFESLSDEARKADILPGLRPNSLISVGKIADADYTTIFHPRKEGVTVHKKTPFGCSCYVSQSSKGGAMQMACGDCHVTKENQFVAVGENKR